MLIKLVFILFYPKNILILYSETLKLSWNIEPKRIEFFQYFDVFMSSVSFEPN